MDRVATDVAKPPIAGGELPSFEELLAKGSFHARLAQARAARERALAEADPSDGFILNTSRKPWDRDDDAPKAGDRLVTALAATAAPSNVTRLHPDPAPADGAKAASERLTGETADCAAAPVRRLHVVPQAAPAEVPPVEPAPPRRRIAMIGGGFVIGLAIGAVAAFGILSLVRPGAWPSPASPRALDAASAPATPQTAAAPDGAGTPTAVTATAVIDAAPLRPLVPRLAQAEGGDPALATAAASASLVALAGFVPTAPEVPAIPADGPVVRPAALSARPEAPPPGSGLPTAAAAEAAPVAQRFDAPAVRLDVSAPAQEPAAEIAETSPLEAVLPRPDVPPAPARTAALDQPAAPDSGLPAQSVPVAPGPRHAGPVVVHAPQSVTGSELAGVIEGLDAEGFVLAEPARVDVTVKQSNVRYFHPEDAEAAAAVAAVLGALVRDFTDFAPTPPAGTIEVWLAGRGTAPAVAGTSTPRRARQATTRPAQTELEVLRDRILRQLRSGEHL